MVVLMLQTRQIARGGGEVGAGVAAPKLLLIDPMAALVGSESGNFVYRLSNMIR